MERKRTITNQKLRKQRVRRQLRGTATKPRLTVTISNRHVSAQLIDDTAQRTLAASSSVGQKSLPDNLTERARWVGEDIAKRAGKAKVSQVVFDRGARRYHGRVAALAEAARAGGVKF